MINNQTATLNLGLSQGVATLTNLLNFKSREEFTQQEELPALAPRPLFPFVGSKKQLLQVLKARIPTNFNRYHEPFVGAGSLGFALQHDNAIFSDSNWDLINTLLQVKENPNAVIENLLTHENTKEYYYSLRNIDVAQLSLIEKASRTIYLYSTCWRGLIRHNKKGQFNVSFGQRKKPKYLNTDNLLAVSRYLNDANVQLLHSDFEAVLKKCKRNDLVYIDSPYIPIKKDSHTSYTKDGFTFEDHVRLADSLREVSARGVKFLASNANCELVHELYRGFDIEIISASRKISSKVENRSAKKIEVLIKNY